MCSRSASVKALQIKKAKNSRSAQIIARYLKHNGNKTTGNPPQIRRTRFGFRGHFYRSTSRLQTRVVCVCFFFCVPPRYLETIHFYERISSVQKFFFFNTKIKDIKDSKFFRLLLRPDGGVRVK